MHVTDGARRFARLAASPLPRACIALTKSEEKERLLAVYSAEVNIGFVNKSKMYLIYSLKRYLFYVFYISQRYVANE